MGTAHFRILIHATVPLKKKKKGKGALIYANKVY